MKFYIQRLLEVAIIVKILHIFFMKHIFIVEDHDSIRESVAQYLELSGYKVSRFAQINDIYKTLGQSIPDLLIQDVMMPDGDGFAFVKQIRSQYTFPVIFMTARNTESDRILGFELGCDDYIVKPFSPKELVLRVDAIFRRMGISGDYQKTCSTHWKVGSATLVFDEISHVLILNDEEMSLTAAEWRIIKYLIANTGNLVTRAQILESCFDYSFESYDRIVDTHIKNIRGKFGSCATDWIETVRGFGYRFSGKKTQGVSE